MIPLRQQVMRDLQAALSSRGQVSQIVDCNPRKGTLLQKRSKSERIDARNQCKPQKVCHGLLSNYWLVTAILVANLLPLTAAAQSDTSGQSVDQLSKRLDALRAEMDNIEAQLDQLKAAKRPLVNSTTAPPSVGSATQEGTIESTLPPAQGPISKHLGEATATYTEFSEDNLSAPRFNNVPLDPRYDGFFKIPGTQTIMKIGGFFKTDFIYDLKPAGNIDQFIPSSFPVPQVSGVYNANVSIRPTRLSLDFRTPSTRLGEVRLYVEGDMFGTNAATPRLRHAYAQMDNLLIGQTWTNFMDTDVIPDTLDYRGPNGMVGLLNPQFRYGFAVSPSATLHLSVERPSSDVFFETLRFAAQPNAPSPDGTVRFRQEFQRGHFQVSAIFRSIAASLPNGHTGTVFGWGVNTSGSVKTFNNDRLILGVVAGHGVSRYIQDISGLGIDAEVASYPQPHLEATPAFGFGTAYQHYWRRTLRSTAVYSYATVNNTDLAPASTYNHGTYTATNLIWNPYGSLNLGAEFLYGWVERQNGQEANAPRFVFSAKYSFAKIKPER